MEFSNSLMNDKRNYYANKAGRKYFPPELKIRKLWKIYNTQGAEYPELQVKNANLGIFF